MRKILLAISTATLALSAGAAVADAFVDAVVANLQAEGYTQIEIEVGPNRLYAEASDGARRIEIVWDRSTGAILWQEVTEDDDEDFMPGVEIEFSSEESFEFEEETESAGAESEQEHETGGESESESESESERGD